MKTLIVALFVATLAPACGAAPAEDETEDSESDLVSDPRGALKVATFSISTRAVQPAGATFVAHSDYVAANVPASPVIALRKSVEKTLGGALKNRGEAHVTTITPPEMAVLERKLDANEIQSVAVDAGVQRAALTPRCIGMGEKGKDRTFFLVVDSSDLIAVRRALAARYIAKGGARGDFEPDKFFPHVTLGFTKRDLFEQDGVVKSVASCPKPAGLEVQP